MKYFLIIILFSFSFFAHAQKSEVSVKGKIIDTKGTEPLVGAVVQVLNPNDSTAYNYYTTLTDSEGQFLLKLKPQKYILKLYSMGFDIKYINIELTKQNLKLDLPNINMKENSILLNDAEIVAKVPPIVVRGDTIEYNANSYSNDENELLNDMLKRIPGIEVDSKGNITANGKPISKILVDGKEFFGNDIAMALNNLPANMIKKLQLFKEQSDESKVTGIKDKDPAQVLNLTVKDELKESIFGNIEAGFGDDGKYKHKLVANAMKNKNQLSIIGNMDNAVDNSNSFISSDDGGGMGIFGADGIDKNKNIGVNFYHQQSDNLKLGGYLRYRKNENKMESSTNSYNFKTQRFSNNESSNISKDDGYNMGISMDWKPDSLTQIYFRSSVSFSDNDTNRRTKNRSYIANNDTTDGFSLATSSPHSLSINNNLMIGRQLGKVGRNISLMFYSSIRNDKGDATNYSETRYPNSISPQIIDQHIKNDGDNDNYSLSIAYTEPIKKDIKLTFKYGITNNKSNRDRRTLRKDAWGYYSVVDSAYTRYSKNKYLNQTIGTGIQINKEKYDFNLGFDLLPSYSRTESSMLDSLIENIGQHVVDYSPNLYFSYKPNSSSSLDISYFGNTTQPYIRQLSSDTVIVNALTKNYGNPDLKMSYTNNLNFYYQRSNYETERFLMINGGFTYTFNEIADYTFVDKDGNTTQTYTNVDGNMGANIGFMYNTPLRNKKFTVNSNTNIYYNKRIGFTNADKSISNNYTFNQTGGIKFRTDIIDVLLNASITHNIIKNNLEDDNNMSYTNYKLNNELSIKLPYDFSVKSQINYAYYAGYDDDRKKNEFIWNASVSKKILKNKKGSISLQFYDIFDNKNPLQRIVDGNSYSDSSSNFVKRYVILNFAYRFNISSKKSKSEASDEVDEFYY